MPPGMVVFYVDGHRVIVQGRGDVRLQFTCGEWVILRDVLHVPTLSKGFISADKFDKGGFNMLLENGKIIISKGRRYVGRTKNCSIMYHLFLSDEGSASGSRFYSNGASVSSVASNDAEVENQLEGHIKILRSDRVEKYFNQEFETFCEENGIKHESTSPNIPQHNGLAERKT
uniref:Integrase catalytic domain-containing protein n=1 Tax=Lactuca sativa TaxID=4236 RepID=A0A9R1UYL8_LACSA|nr:hypothetical protein LSAT_V11C700373410 [Lactuca sativa]